MRIFGAIALTIVLAVMLLIGYGISRGVARVTLPVPSGRLAVGRQTIDLTDANRIDPFDGRHGHRRLNVWIWYPAVGADASKAAYYPGETGYAPVLLGTQFSAVQTNSVEDAAPAPAQRLRRILIMEPGLGGAAPFYTTLAENLASHGYVVFGINPTYSTDVHFKDGTFVHSVDKARDKADFPALSRIWGSDVAFVWRQIQSGKGLPSATNSELDKGSVGIFGHSLGGSAALSACESIPACTAAADIDGDINNSSVRGNFGKPLFYLGHDGTFVEQPSDLVHLRGMFKRNPHGRVFVATISGTSHFNFEDRALMYDPVGRALHIMGPIDGARGLVIVRETLEEFFDAFPAAGARAFTAAKFPELNWVRMST